MEKIKEFALNALIEGAKEIVNKIVKKEIFTGKLCSTINFLVGDSTNNDRFNEILLNLFDKNNIRELNKKINIDNGFTLIQIIERHLRENLDSVDLDENYKEKFISDFIIVLLDYLKEKRPDVYDEYVTQEMYDKQYEMSDKINSISEELEKLKTSINELSFVETSYEIEAELRKNTKPSIDLSFFKPEDNKLFEYLSNHISSNENMYIICSTSEEAKYTVLYELSKFKKNTYVVNNLDNWMKLKKRGLSNAILIPSFDAEKIEPIQNCINIFIYSEESLCVNRDKFKISRRKRRTIEKRLELFTNNVREASNLVKSTLGFFVPLMDKIYMGQRNIKYDVNENDIMAVCAGMLVQKWTNNDGDKLLLKSLSGMNYDSFLTVIEKYRNDDNPLFVRVQNWGDIKYCLTSPEKAFCECYKLIPYKLKKDFFELASLVISTIDNRLNESLSETITAQIKGIKCDFSNSLRSGIFESLAIIKCVLNIHDTNTIIDNIIDSYLKQIDNTNKWADLSKFISIIADISPQKFIEMFEHAFENDTGIIDIFKLKSNVMFGNHYYCNYLWALEQLLVQDDYYLDAINILFRLNSFEIEYNISNSPKQVLKNIFCPWMNISCLKPSNKASILQKYCDLYENAYLIAMENLPEQHTCVFNINYPKYRQADYFEETVLLSECFNCYEDYLEICLKYVKDVDKIISLIKELSTFNQDLIKISLSKIYDCISKYSDSQKETIRFEIFTLINHHRYYCTSSWAMDEEKIKLFLEFAEKIRFECEEYNYVYLFKKRSYDFPLLNPVPYEKDISQNNEAINKYLIEKEINEKIKLFKKRGLSIKKLISISDSSECVLGYYIHCFVNSDFSKDMMNLILCTQKNNVIIEEYFRYLRYNQEKIDYDALEQLVNSNYDEKEKALIVSNYPINDEMLDFLEKRNENFLSAFWKFRNFNFQGLSIKSLDRCYNNIIKYGSLNSFLAFLNNIKGFTSPEYVYNKLSAYEDMNFINIDYPYNQYLIQETLKYVYPYVFEDKQRLEVIAAFELKLWHLLKWHDMKCFQIIIKEQPNLYLELVLLIFSKLKNKEQQKLASNLYSLYSKMVFCPGEKNGVVDEVIFNRWINTFVFELNKNNLSNICDSILGKLFAYSPICQDNYPIDYPVRDYIEKNYSDNLMSAYVCAIQNQRGIYTCTQGEAEHSIAITYKRYAKYFKEQKYFNCSKLYDILSKEYENHSLIEREKALYE